LGLAVLGLVAVDSRAPGSVPPMATAVREVVVESEPAVPMEAPAAMEETIAYRGDNND
jgi:hypothetical protein